MRLCSLLHITKHDPDYASCFTWHYGRSTNRTVAHVPNMLTPCCIYIRAAKHTLRHNIEIDISQEPLLRYGANIDVT
jgi:hypothetical protein